MGGGKRNLGTRFHLVHQLCYGFTPPSALGGFWEMGLSDFLDCFGAHCVLGNLEAEKYWIEKSHCRKSIGHE